MKQGKRVKPKFPIEYRLLITRHYKERELKTVTLVAIRTVIEFTNFLYEIIVEPILEAHSLHLKIHGLRAPQVSIPGTGPAKSATEFDDLKGHYIVTVTKPGGEENSFEVFISRENVKVEKSPRKKFVDLVTTIEEW